MKLSSKFVLSTCMITVAAMIHVPIASAQTVLWYSYGASGTPTVLSDISISHHDASVSGSIYTSDRPKYADFIPGVSTTAGSLLIDGNNGSGARTIDSKLLPLTLVQASGGYTIETWFKRTALNNNDASEGQKLVDDIEGLYIPRNTDDTGTYMGITTPGQRDFLYTTVPVGEWHHLAVTFDSGTNIAGADGSLDATRILYLDGNYVDGNTITFQGIRDTSLGQIGIGRFHGDPMPALHPQNTEAFNGSLFETRISLGVLKPADFLLPHVANVPEPGALATLIGTAFVGSLLLRRRRKLIL